MKQKKHNLFVELPDKPVQLHGDPVRLTQIFLNLLSNAANYTREGGTIRVTGTCHDDILELCVQDTGIGMAPEMLEKVFDAFIQLENPHGRTRGGLGIGLTLARALVRMHGGSIRAESDGPGKGSRFTVMLPLHFAEGTELPAMAAVSPAEGTQRRILVVDDNEDAALTLSMQLRIAGHELRVAFDGKTALELGKMFLPDVVLMDIGMPGMNGLDTARALRQEPWGKDVLLIAITGWGQAEDKRQTHDAGFDHHLVKPVRAVDIEGLLAPGLKPALS
jgi:CheY-like chemotaxis protein